MLFQLIFFLSLFITNSDQQDVPNSTAAIPSAPIAPAPIAPVVNNPASQTAANNNIPEYLGSLCQPSNASSCTLITNSLCVDAGDNSGQYRCRCRNLYYAYSITPTVPMSYKCGLELTTAVNAACQQCQQNGGTCVGNATTSPTIVCQCPDFLSGTDCEIVNVNVTCSGYDMKICYLPQTNVNFSNNWIMFAAGQMSNVECVGTPGNTQWCPLGFQQLQLSLNATDYATCHTQLNYGTQNIIYSNEIMLEQLNDAGEALTNVSSYVFNVYCSFVSYENQNFNGLGISSVNGNDRGTQDNPTVIVTIVDQFNSAIPEGSFIDVGDFISLVVSLTLDGVYGNIQVIGLTASTSAIMPDTEAETRPLMSQGCPVIGESTANSWYWERDLVSNFSLQLQSLPFPAFVLSSSNELFFHGNIKVCLLGDNTCLNYNQTYCEILANFGVVKRDLSKQVDRLIRRTKRSAATQQVNVQTGIQINGGLNSSPSPNDNASSMTVGSPGFIALIVILIIISIILIASVVIAILMMSNRKSKSSIDRYQNRPQIFPLPKISRTHERF